MRPQPIDPGELTAIEARLLAQLERAGHYRRPGSSWYPIARREAERLAKTHALPVVTVAGIIAAVSPLIEWTQNLRNAERLLDHWSRGEPIPYNVAATHRQRRAALAILAARPRTRRQLLSILSGRKVRPFALAILGDRDAITVDRHIIRAAGHDPERVTTAAFRTIVEAIRRLAERLKITPRTLQAWLWLIQREDKPAASAAR